MPSLRRRRPGHPRRRERGLQLILALLACATLEDDRGSWLVEQLQVDNQRWLARDPALLETKLAKMATDRYDFMRGTATVGVNDWTRADGDREPTAFLRARGTESVLLAGDPHPENVGTLHPGGELLLLEVNDLDGATYGPFVWDVRRAMLGLGALVEPTGCTDTCLDDVWRAYASAYARGILDPSFLPRGYRAGQDLPVILDDLIVSATEDGRERTVEREELVLDGENPRWVRDTTLDAAGRGDLRLTAEEALQVDRLADGLGVDLIDAVRRYGQGVASLPAIRYLLLVREGDEVRLLQLREVIDPLPMPGWRAVLDGSFEDNADRIVRVSQDLWARPDADPGLDAVEDGTMVFKVTTMSGYQRGFSHTRIAGRRLDGRFDDDDLVAWAEVLGAQLARVHSQAPVREGGTAGVAIATALDGDEEAFVEEQRAAAQRGLVTLERDHTLFRTALDRLGPSLGMR